MQHNEDYVVMCLIKRGIKMNNKNGKIKNESTEETTDKKPTHLWRCMNCNKMTYEYVCTYCGNPSYNKTVGAKEISRKCDITSANSVQHEEQTKVKDKTPADYTLKKELESLVDKLNQNITDTKKG